MKMINAKSDHLFIDQFQIKKQEAWCIVGSNQSGIEEFFGLCTDTNTRIQAQIELPETPCIISFKIQQQIYESELKKDETDFLDRIDPGTLARSFIHDPEGHMDLITAFDLHNCLDQGYRQLSTGQSRKLIMLSHFTRGTSFFIVQSPFDGLDPESCREVENAFSYLHQQSATLLFFVHNMDDIPSCCTHVGAVLNGRLAVQGEKEKVMDALEKEMADIQPDFQMSVLGLYEKKGDSTREDDTRDLIQLADGAAGYGDHMVFADLTLTVQTGDHTLISGPNGSGKSTLLQVITGDHPACYQNDLKIFGIQRGSGESIWELKKKMGIVSSELHRNYYVPGSALQCVLSGLFDSIGLYQPVSQFQEQLAFGWLSQLNMAQKAQLPFRKLSFSDQRLILIARALIKVPQLLILDEPTQGLDELNRNAVLEFLNQVAHSRISTIVYVSHRRDEFRDFFVQHIKM